MSFRLPVSRQACQGLGCIYVLRVSMDKALYCFVKLCVYLGALTRSCLGELTHQ